MPDVALLALIVVAMLAGYLLGRRDLRKKNHSQSSSQPLSKEYFVGLNYLLNEQTDEAIETFIKALDLNNDTVDTYLALGSLFARRGEVEKSIRVHQDLLARPSLTSSQSLRVQLELAKDFMQAGLLDRAEAMLADMARNNHEYRPEALQQLLKIYEQEREWSKAVTVGEELRKTGADQYAVVLAHFYCEGALICLERNDRASARKAIRQAFTRDKNCVRASLLLARMEFDDGRYRDCIKALEKVALQNSHYVPLTLELLEQAYSRLGNVRGFTAFLGRCLIERPGGAVILAMTKVLASDRGDEQALRFLTDQLGKNPSLKGLNALMALQLRNPAVGSLQSIRLLKEMTDKMLELKPVYQCNSCGFSGKEMHWMCPGCHSWGAIAPVQGIEGE